MGYIITTLSRIWEATMAAIGAHLVIGLGGIIFLGFPAAFWWGAYGYAILAHAGFPIALALTSGVVLSAAAGALFAFFYPRMSNDSFAVLTLASVLATDALIRSWDSLTGGVLGIAGVPRMSPTQTLQELMMVQGVLVLCALVGEWLIIRSPFGRSLRALKENKDMLRALGTSAEHTGKVALYIAALCAGAAGMLTAMRIQFLDPSLGGLVLLVQILTIAIIANASKTLRLFGATALIVLLPEALRFFNLPVLILGYSRNFMYAVLLMVLIYYVMGNSKTKRYV